MKLSIPNLYLWIAMFFSLFHVQLNILAEVLRFADREFYQVSQRFWGIKFQALSFQGLVELQKSWWILEALEPSRTLLVLKTRLQPPIEEGSEQDRFYAYSFLYFSRRSWVSCECIDWALVLLGFSGYDDTSSHYDHPKIYGGCKDYFFFLIIS